MLAQFLNGFWGFELSPHASKVNTFLTEPFPSSLPFHFALTTFCASYCFLTRPLNYFLSGVLFPLDWKPYWGRDDQSVLPLSPFLGFFVATSSGPRAVP